MVLFLTKRRIRAPVIKRYSPGWGGGEIEVENLVKLSQML